MNSNKDNQTQKYLRIAAVVTGVDLLIKLALIALDAKITKPKK